MPSYPEPRRIRFVALALLVAGASSGCGSDDHAAANSEPRGRFEVSGAVEIAVAEVAASPPIWEGYGGGWSFALSDQSAGYGVTFFNLPVELLSGEYPLAERPTIPGDVDPATLEFPPSAIFSEWGDRGDERWDEAPTGTLTVESVENGTISGHFEFSVDQVVGEAVTVLGSFENVKMPESLD